MRFPVSQIAWRRTNQFSNLVGVLELRAIDLDDRAGIPKQDLRRRFDDAGFSGSSGPQKQQVPYRAPRRIQAGAKHLVQEIGRASCRERVEISVEAAALKQNRANR